MDINFKLEVFEGPLDLLLHLLDKNKVNIYDIPIVEITEQYMAYIRQMQRQDLAIMSEFMVMAATLLDIKSRMLLPADDSEDEEGEDPRAELVQQLLEYKLYKCMAIELKDRQLDASKAFYKPATIPEEVAAYQPPVDTAELMADVTLSQLNAVFQSVIKRQRNRIDPVRSKFGEIKQEEISMEDKMAYLRAYMELHPAFSFRQLLEDTTSRVELIVTFLVVLELMKAGLLMAEQAKIFGDIQLRTKVNG